MHILCTRIQYIKHEDARSSNPKLFGDEELFYFNPRPGIRFVDIHGACEIKFEFEFKCRRSEGLIGRKAVCTRVVYVCSQVQLPDIRRKTHLEAILEVELNCFQVEEQSRIGIDMIWFFSGFGWGFGISRVRSFGRDTFPDLDSPFVYSTSDPEHCDSHSREIVRALVWNV
jgi:hypothetical protein